MIRPIGQSRVGVLVSMQLLAATLLDKEFSSVWYLDQPSICENAKGLVEAVVLFLDQFSFLVVMSLVIMADVHRFFVVYFVQNDDLMQGCKVQHGEVITDACQLDLVLTDKTGTITTGEKVVRKLCHWSSNKWVVLSPEQLASTLADSTEAVGGELLLFLHAMTMCNTIDVVSVSNDEQRRRRFSVDPKGTK